MILAWMVGISVFGGLIVVCIGLSYLSQSLNALDYCNAIDQDAYNSNPLVKLGSKYYHWRPKGAVVITKKKWKIIQDNIAREIEDAKSKGIQIGRAEALKELESHLVEKQEKVGFPTNPYKILDVSSTDTDAEIEEAFRKLIDLYSDKRFEPYDAAFKDLASIRRHQIRKAFNKIAAGISPSEDKKATDFSGGMF